MITSPPKRGMALVVVLVLLAVMMLVTITLSGRMQQQLGRTRSQQESWSSVQAIPVAVRMTLHSPQWGEIERIWLLRGPQLS